LIWASPPCETFTNHAYNASPGRVTVDAPHGCNYRNHKHPERPPCCTDPKCKYAAKARLHDKFLPWLQNMHAVNAELGLPYHWAIENPDAGMKLRPYARLENWPEPLVAARKTVDECTMGHDAKKPTMIYTDMIDLEYIGSTGDGRCHNLCDAIVHHPDGSKRHKAAYAQEPARQLPAHQKAVIPERLSAETMTAAIQRRSSSKQRIVIDSFCGRASLAPVARKLGLRYVGVDIKKYRRYDPTEG
jgi:hypothetical protein